MVSLAEWSNVRIDFKLGAPLCLSWTYLHGDGVIAHLAARQADPDAYRKLDSKHVNRNIRGEPVVYRRGIPHCSVAVIDDGGILTYHRIYKRFEEGSIFNVRQIRMPRGFKVRLGQGFYKSAAIKLATIPARMITFYTKCKLDKVKELLPGLPALGKKSSIGFGIIKSYKITETDADYSVVKDGIAMRQVPTKYLDSWEKDQTYWGTWRAPYWSTEIELCAAPGSKIKLKSRHELDKIERATRKKEG